MTRVYSVLLAVCLALLVISLQPLRAENPDHVKQLKETGKCPACDLSKANLRAARIDQADLSGADLTEADLYMAFLPGANLAGANLYGANLNAADLTGATDVNFTGARTDQRTTCPNGKRGPCQ